jgi:hypothetical protein
MEYDPEEGAEIASWASAFVGDRWNQYLNHWGIHSTKPAELSEKDWRLRRSLDQLGESLRKAIHSLSVESDVVDAARAVLNAAGLAETEDSLSPLDMAHLAPGHPIVRDCIEFSLGFEAVDRLLPTATERVYTLLDLIAHRRLSKRAAAYLDRATRLYLWGFDPECVIMAHAVLEAATAEVITDEKLSELGVKARNKVFSSAQRIAAARELGIFTEEDEAKANALRRARNDTVHLAPGTETNAEEAVRNLARLLSRLFRSAAT